MLINDCLFGRLPFQRKTTERWVCVFQYPKAGNLIGDAKHSVVAEGLKTDKRARRHSTATKTQLTERPKKVYLGRGAGSDMQSNEEIYSPTGVSSAQWRTQKSCGVERT